MAPERQEERYTIWLCPECGYVRSGDDANSQSPARECWRHGTTVVSMVRLLVVPERLLVEAREGLMAEPLPAIRSVLAAYRSEPAKITEDQITAAWAEYERVRRVDAGAGQERERVDRQCREMCTQFAPDTPMPPLSGPSVRLREALRVLEEIAKPPESGASFDEMCKRIQLARQAVERLGQD